MTCKNFNLQCSPYLQVLMSVFVIIITGINGLVSESHVFPIWFEQDFGGKRKPVSPRKCTLPLRWKGSELVPAFPHFLSSDSY